MSKVRDTLMKVLPHVSKDERALLVVVNFSTGGEPRFQCSTNGWTQMLLLWQS